MFKSLIPKYKTTNKGHLSRRNKHEYFMTVGSGFLGLGIQSK